MTSVEKRVYVIYEGQLITNHIQYYRELEEINHEEKVNAINLTSEFSRIRTELLNLFGGRFADRDPSDFAWGNEIFERGSEKRVKAVPIGSLGMSLKSSHVGQMIEKSMEPYDEFEKKKKKLAKPPVIPLFTNGRFLIFLIFGV